MPSQSRYRNYDNLLYPEMFGALGNGGDDYEGLQAAINAAVTNKQTLRIPEKKYYSTKSLIANGKVSIQGMGLDSQIWGSNVLGALLSISHNPTELPTGAAIVGGNTKCLINGTYTGIILSHFLDLKYSATNPSLRTMTDFSISMVCQSSSPYDTYWFCIQKSGLVGAKDFKLALTNNGGYSLLLNLTQNDSSILSFTNTTLTIPLNTTTHVRFVRQGTTLKSYINGVLSTTTTNVTGYLNVDTYDDVTIMGMAYQFMGEVATSAQQKLDSFSLVPSALNSGNFTPPTTIDASGNLIWLNADNAVSTQGYVPIQVSGANRAAFINSASDSFDAAGSVIKDLALYTDGTTALNLSGAPGSKISGIKTDGYGAIGVFLRDNCYHSFLINSDINLAHFAGVISNGHSACITLDNNHFGFGRGAGVIVTDGQESITMRRQFFDSSHTAPFIIAGSEADLQVVIDNCFSEQENGSIGDRYLAGITMQGGSSLDVRSSGFESNLDATTANTAPSIQVKDVGSVRVDSSLFLTGPHAPAIISHINPTLRKTQVTSSWKYPSGVPWAPSGDEANVSLVAVSG